MQIKIIREVKNYTCTITGKDCNNTTKKEDYSKRK